MIGTVPLLRGSIPVAVRPDTQEKVCVFTELFGAFDDLRAPPKHLIDPSVDFYVITDAAGAGYPAPWQEYVVSPLPYDDMRKNSRNYKMIPPDELWNKCDIGIHVDANIDFLRSPLELARELQPLADLGLIRHPFLPNYQAEIDHLCQVYPKDCDKFRAHAERQQESGFDPRSAHQYEMSVFLRRHNERTKFLMKTWREGLFNSGFMRDQVILVPMLHGHNADIELYGPGGRLLIPPPANGKSKDPVIYTKPWQQGSGSPSFIQVYRGHNHDFGKWRCHGKVMGQQRSEFTHSAYCGVYYVTKRYIPWLEQLVPVTYNSIKTLDLKNPVKAAIVSLLFFLFASAVFFPRSSIMLHLRTHWVNHSSRSWHDLMSQYGKIGKTGMLALRMAIVVSVAFGMAIAYFYTWTMGVACLWSGSLLCAPPLFAILLCRRWYLDYVCAAA